MTPDERTTEFPYMYAALVLLVAGMFMFSIQSALSPVIAYVVLLVLLAPYMRRGRHSTVVIAATLALLVWSLETLGSLLAPFVLAFVLAYILDPIVDRLQRHRVPRIAGAMIVVLPMLTLIGLAVGFGIPALINQIDSLIDQLPTAAARASAWFEEVRAGSVRWRLPFVSDEAVARMLDPARISAAIESRQGDIAQGIWNRISDVGRGISAVFSILGFLVLTPVLAIYLLKDFDTVTARIADIVPLHRRESWFAFATEYDRLLSRFLRGQLAEAILVGLLTWIGLRIAGVPYAGVVGVVAGVFNLVPYLGLVVSCIPVFIIALFSGSFVAIIVRAAIVFIIVQTIDSTITGPRIVGGSVGLHPVWVILALTIGAAAFGFVGLLIAVPVAALVKLLLLEGLQHYHRSVFYLGTEPPSQ